MGTGGINGRLGIEREHLEVELNLKDNTGEQWNGIYN